MRLVWFLRKAMMKKYTVLENEKTLGYTEISKQKLPQCEIYSGDK